jgi:hypothetical protein
MGYDVDAKREVAPSVVDANDLLLMSLGDALSHDLLDGMAWAVQHRDVDWALHFDHARVKPHYSEALLALIRRAGIDVKESNYPPTPEPGWVAELDRKYLS